MNYICDHIYLYIKKKYNMERLIYSLKCPFTGKVHYIGKSTNGMLKPLGHAKESHSKKVREWVNNLRDIGHKPDVEILENVSNNDNIDDRERYWIQYYLSKGALLLNDVLITPMILRNDLEGVLGGSEGREMEIIGNFVKQRRKMVGLTQDEFAEKCGLALTVIRKIEQGKSNMNLDGLLIVLKMFGATLDVVKINN